MITFKQYLLSEREFYKGVEYSFGKDMDSGKLIEMLKAIYRDHPKAGIRFTGHPYLNYNPSFRFETGYVVESVSASKQVRILQSTKI